MTRKITRILAVVLVLALVLSTTALAVDSKQENAANTPQIQALNIMVDGVNSAIVWMVSCAQATPYDDIEWLQAMVEIVTAPVFAYANAIGAIVTCVYDTYYIDGQYVQVDPLIVINEGH